MKKSGFFVALLALLSMALLPGRALAAERYPLEEEKAGNGLIQIYTFGATRLHVYQTADPLADVCFALESATQIVAIESPAFKADIETWKNYLAALQKPLTDILIASHPAGGVWYGNAKSHASAGAKAAISSGSTRELTEALGQAFGPDFIAQIPSIDAVLTGGTHSIGGMRFEIIEAGDGYEIALPTLGIIYTHMLGADTHSILAGQDHINAVIASLEHMKSAGYSLILSSHHAPESPADVDTKIAYIKNIQLLAAQSKDRADFLARVAAEYPDYKGVNYLEMTADYLFGK